LGDRQIAVGPRLAQPCLRAFQVERGIQCRADQAVELRIAQLAPPGRQILRRGGGLEYGVGRAPGDGVTT